MDLNNRLNLLTSVAFQNVLLHSTIESQIALLTVFHRPTKCYLKTFDDPNDIPEFPFARSFRHAIELIKKTKSVNLQRIKVQLEDTSIETLCLDYGLFLQWECNTNDHWSDINTTFSSSEEMARQVN